MDDLISRQAAIDALVKYVADGYAESPNDFEGYMELIRELPSAQPERKKGKWIEITDHEIPIICECSECEWPTVFHDIFNYCPNCGAEMREET